MKRILLLGVLLVYPATAEAVTRTVCASGCTHTTIQAAVTAAAYGDVIQIQAGTTFTEQVILPDKGANPSGQYITLTTTADPALLPPEGHRLDPVAHPEYLARMPKIKSPGGEACIKTALRAHHYKFLFIHVLHNPGGFAEMFEFGDASVIDKARADQPSDIIIDRSYFQGDHVDGQKRGVSLNGANLTIRNSYFVNMAANGADAQCAGGWNGTGPIVFENNYCMASTENFMFGGSDPLSRTRMTCTGSRTTTGCAVATSEATHTLSELVVGDRLAIDVVAGSGITLEFVKITSINGTGATGAITWAPALSTLPDTTASSLRHDTVVDNITVRNNFFTKDVTWRDYIIPAPTSPGAKAGSGGTLTGTKYYKWVATAIGQADIELYSPASSETSATAGGGNGTITVTCTPSMYAEGYRLYRGTSPGAENEYVTDTDCSVADNGSLSWTAGSPFGATRWIFKNLFQLKFGTNVIVEGNIFEHSWEDNFSGGKFAWWLKSENQNDGGGCWSCIMENVTFDRNIVRHSFGWFELVGQYAVNGSPIVTPDKARNITIKNTLIYDCNGEGNPVGWGVGPGNTEGYTIQMANTDNFILDHNTIICGTDNNMHSFIALIQEGVGVEPGFTVKNNLARRGTYGIRCNNEGKPALDDCVEGAYVFSNNTVAGANCGIYPATTLCPSLSEWYDAFITYSHTGVGANYRIKPGHAYKNAGTDGKDLGADIDAVMEATRDTETGIPTSAPSVPSTPNPVRIRITPGEE